MLDKINRMLAIIILATFLFECSYIYDSQQVRKEILETNEKIKIENLFILSYKNLLETSNNVNISYEYSINENIVKEDIKNIKATKDKYLHDNYYIKENKNNYTIYLEEDNTYIYNYTGVFTTHCKKKEYYDYFDTPELLKLYPRLNEEDFYRECLDLIYALNSGNYDYKITSFDNYYVINAALDSKTFFKLFNTKYIKDLPDENAIVNYIFYVDKDTYKFNKVSIDVEYNNSTDYLNIEYDLSPIEAFSFNTENVLPLKNYTK